jgi:hypothetical protein
MWQRSNTPSYDKNRAGQQCASAGMTALGMTRLADEGWRRVQARSNTAIDSTCAVCGNMLTTPAALQV